MSFGEISSQNVVGFNGINNEKMPSTAVGGLFFTVGGEAGDTYKLSQITVEGVKEAGSKKAVFMSPVTEYIQQLDPDGCEVIARYTYVSKEFVEASFDPDDEAEEYNFWMSNLGWWDWGPKSAYIGVEGHKRDNEDIAVGTAFLGYFGNNLRFVSSGSVPLVETSIGNDSNPSPFFLNYLPVTIPLKAIVVEGVQAAGSKKAVFMSPVTEYLQVLDPDGCEVIARYTYVSKAFVDASFDPVDEEEDYNFWMSNLGWWDWGPKSAYIGVEGHSRDNFSITPGYAFLGYLGNNLKFNFPAATATFE